MHVNQIRHYLHNRFFANYYFISDKRCWLHIGQSHSKENVIAFTEETLRNCYARKESRDSTKRKKSKYDVIVLPKEVDGTAGYHATCYRYFCLIKTRDHESTKVEESKSGLCLV